MSANQVRSTVNKKNHQYSGSAALPLKSTYFPMQVDMDLPNVICSLDALVGVTTVLDAFGVAMLVPQLPQNFTLSEFSLPHFGQNILLFFSLDKESDNTGVHVA